MWLLRSRSTDSPCYLQTYSSAQMGFFHGLVRCDFAVLSQIVLSVRREKKKYFDWKLDSVCYIFYCWSFEIQYNTRKYFYRGLFAKGLNSRLIKEIWLFQFSILLLNGLHSIDHFLHLSGVLGKNTFQIDLKIRKYILEYCIL